MTKPKVVSNLNAPSDVNLIGGKARALLQLGEAGFPVPAWICVTTEISKQFASMFELEQETTGGKGGSKPISDSNPKAPHHWERVRLKEEDLHEVLSACDATFNNNNRHFAVRSSSPSEDSSSDSFAGQLESFLNITRAQLGQHISKTIASACASHVRSYQRLRGYDVAPLVPAVIIQEMVDAQVSGVLFTINPTTGDSTQAVVTAGYGLGEGLVGNTVSVDTYLVDLATGDILDQRILSKRTKVVMIPGGGTQTVDVLDGVTRVAALTSAQVRQLVALGNQIQNYFGQPQDIEWALDPSGKIILLQSRPVTAHPHEQIFDNSNVVENYPDLSLPLTFSVARQSYETTFRATSRSFGVPKAIIRQHHAVYSNLIGIIKGRIYYNILNWYEIFLMVPGFEGLIPAWEKALGLKPRTIQPRRWSAPFQKFRMILRILKLLARRQRDVCNFTDRFEALHDEFRAKNLRALPPENLFRLYETITSRLFEPFRITLVNDFVAQQSYDLLGKLIVRWDLGDPQHGRIELLTGLSEVISLAPVSSMSKLADQVKSNAGLSDLLASNTTSSEVWRIIHEDSDLDQVRGSLDDHLKRFGARMIQDLKLETPSVTESPELLIDMLRKSLDNGTNQPEAERCPPPVIQNSEQTILLRLGFRPIRNSIFRLVLRLCRGGVRDRENLRMLRSRAYDMVRQIAIHLGDRFVDAGRIAHQRDIFYLTIQEIEGAIRRSGVSNNLQILIEQRKKEYENYALQCPASRITTMGLRDETDESVVTAADGGTKLQGTGCSAGTATGVARIIENPNGATVAKGEVIVTKSTDPGWVFLMATAGAIVVEHGNVLSHAAIVSRELGIPMVAGVQDATRIIHDGCTLLIDGNTGIVKIL